MCRNIKPLFNFKPEASDEEIRSAALQCVRKISGFKKPSKRPTRRPSTVPWKTSRGFQRSCSPRSKRRRGRRTARRKPPKRRRDPRCVSEHDPLTGSPASSTRPDERTRSRGYRIRHARRSVLQLLFEAAYAAHQVTRAASGVVFHHAVQEVCSGPVQDVSEAAVYVLVYKRFGRLLHQSGAYLLDDTVEHDRRRGSSLSRQRDTKLG